MRVLIVLLAALSPAAALAGEAPWAPAVSVLPRFSRAAAPAAVRAAAAPPAAAPSLSDALRRSLRERLALNPVAARFALPLLDSVTLTVRRESEDPGLKGTVASFKRDSRLLTLNSDAVSQDMGETAPADAVAARYLPVIVHELGGHARHYAELQRLLGRPAANARETEVCALWLEAMTAAAERRRDPSYLRDESSYARSESRLVDEYWAAKRRGSMDSFRAYVNSIPGYARIPAARGEEAAYYAREAAMLWAADRELVGPDAPDDERDAGAPARPRFGRF